MTPEQAPQPETAGGKKLSLHKMIPNMITITAMCTGMTSIKFAIAGKWEAAVIAIVVACFMDAFDGAAARLLKASSKLGAELDSFSDLTCFGIAPAIVTYLWVTEDIGRWGWMVALLFAVAVALRLARFNLQKEDTDEKDPSPLDKYLSGVPSPTGAGLLLLPMIVSFQLEEPLHYLAKNPWLVMGWTLFLAVLMVSRIPTFSSKQIRVPHKMMIPALAVFGLFVAGLINNTWQTLTLMGIVYLILIPISMRHHQKHTKRLASTAQNND